MNKKIGYPNGDIDGSRQTTEPTYELEPPCTTLTKKYRK